MTPALPSARAGGRAVGARHRAVAGVLSLAMAWPVAAQDAATVPASPAASGPAEAPAAPASAAHEALSPWTLATLPDDPVPFRGLANLDNAGLGAGNMLYPTGGLGVLGLLVGVATHAAIVGGARASQETKLQQAADKVLDPYRGTLAQFRLRDLEQRALAAMPPPSVAHLRDAKDAPPGDAFVETAPAFAMTPDSAALVLDATVVVRPSAGSDKGVQQVLRVVSAPRPEANLQAAWSADEGAALKATAASLMADSLDVALRLSRRPADDKQAFRTLRYGFGDRERMERGQLLDETCGRMVIRTLRGALLVVPHRAGAALPDGCPAAPAVAERVRPEPPSAAASGVSAAAAPAASAASAGA